MVRGLRIVDPWLIGEHDDARVHFAAAAELINGIFDRRINPRSRCR